MKLDDRILSEITNHAHEQMPRESCGIVVIFKGRYIYVKCNNLSEDKDCFIIDPEDYARAEDMGEIVLFVHSHVYENPQPSQADLTSCEKFGIPWLIISVPDNALHIFSPSGFRAPLVGREFSHGILDCYTLIKDYYQETLSIELPDFHREDRWWDKGLRLYLDNFGKAGFKKVLEKPKKHDVILMQVQSPTPNHAAIWLDDGKILHHQPNRLSSRDTYGGWYQKVTTDVLRYKDFLK